MRRVLVPLLIAAAATAGVATAQSGDKVTATAKAGKGGTPEKPKNTNLSYRARITGPSPDIRADPALELVQTWTGLKDNSKYFPTCTAKEIDAAQSDASCPKAAVVGVGRLEAVVGVEEDKSQMLPCKRNIKLYNEGPGKFNIFSSGNPADCLGILYFAPVVGTIKKVGKLLRFSIPVPENIRYPLPGITGYFSYIELNPVKNNLAKGPHGERVTWVQSIGCGKASRRKFTFTAITTTVPKGITAKAKAGAC